MTKEKKPPKSTRWCFTDFHQRDWGKDFEMYDNLRYIMYGVEKCPTTGRLHQQGWMQFKKRMGFSTLQKRWVGVNLFACNGTVEENEKYCRKDGDVHVWGEFVTQGNRGDLKEVIDNMLANEESLWDVAIANPDLYCRYRGGFRDIYNMSTERNADEWRGQLEVIVITGKTGKGKTRFAKEEATYSIKARQMDWWDGYDRQDCILIDEYDTQVPIDTMLGLLDGYKLRLPIKGGFTYAWWHKVYITSNVPFNEWHPLAKTAHKEALARRVTEWIEMGPEGLIHHTREDIESIATEVEAEPGRF